MIYDFRKFDVCYGYGSLHMFESESVTFTVNSDTIPDHTITVIEALDYLDSV